MVRVGLSDGVRVEVVVGLQLFQIAVSSYGSAGSSVARAPGTLGGCHRPLRDGNSAFTRSVLARGTLPCLLASLAWDAPGAFDLVAMTSATARSIDSV